MVFNATLNNISFISWWSVLLVGKTGVPGANHRTVSSHVICMHEPYTLPNYVCQDFVAVNQCTYRILINDVLDLLILVHRRSKHSEDLVTTKDSIQWKTKNTNLSEQFQNSIENLYKEAKSILSNTHIPPLTYQAWYRNFNALEWSG